MNIIQLQQEIKELLAQINHTALAFAQKDNEELKKFETGLRDIEDEIEKMRNA